MFSSDEKKICLFFCKNDYLRVRVSIGVQVESSRQALMKFLDFVVLKTYSFWTAVYLFWLYKSNFAKIN